jgi:hypothetical protein
LFDATPLDFRRFLCRQLFLILRGYLGRKALLLRSHRRKVFLFRRRGAALGSVLGLLFSVEELVITTGRHPETDLVGEKGCVNG